MAFPILEKELGKRLRRTPWPKASKGGPTGPPIVIPGSGRKRAPKGANPAMAAYARAKAKRIGA